MRILPLSLIILAAWAPAVSSLAASYDDPDWPCIQRKVPALAIGQMWGGPIPDEIAAADWRPPAELRTAASEIAPRRVPMQDVEAKASALVAKVEGSARGERLAALFATVLRHLNRERGEIIEGIGRYAHRQKDLSVRVDGMQQELARLEKAPEDERDMDRIEELQDELAWEARVFKERAQSLSYVCEAPVLIERRAFEIARTLAGLV
ncbi:MAG: hypothetical protein KDE35_04660 [Geminicoccaceae bacterium]|nr:hypothetical protein [Geminicoccaceae bacterium]